MKKKSASRKPAVLSEGVSIYAVAEKAGVSIVTVSRVFNDYPHVSQRMRHRVFAAARDVGYTPRLVSKPKVMAVIVGHLDHLSAGDYKTRLMLDIIRTAAKNGYLVEFIPYDAVELATKHLVDAIVEVGLTDDEMLRLDHLPPVPTIVINKASPRPHWSSVRSDQHYEGLLSTSHLIGAGHRRIALIVDDPRGWGVEQRRAGYEQAARDAKLKDFNPTIFCSSESSPLEIARQMSRGGCTACVNLTDNFGFAVLDACANEVKLRIPEDLSVVCLENKAVSQFWSPRLTTIEQPLDAIAEAVVKGLIELLEHPGKRLDRVLKCRLIERDSVRLLK